MFQVCGVVDDRSPAQPHENLAERLRQDGDHNLKPNRKLAQARHCLRGKQCLRGVATDTAWSWVGPSAVVAGRTHFHRGLAKPSRDVPRGYASYWCPPPPTHPPHTHTPTTPTPTPLPLTTHTHTHAHTHTHTHTDTHTLGTSPACAPVAANGFGAAHARGRGVVVRHQAQAAQSDVARGTRHRGRPVPIATA